MTRLMESARGGEVLTGMLFLDPGAPDLATRLGLVEAPLATLPPAQVRPPRAVLDAINASLR
jgi:2-oxoglutarate ferredoxin oxidoreductase subunit beta